MKNASEIITSLQNKPRFSKLSHFKCIHRIVSLFSLPVQKMVKFSYIKNKILFLVLNHPVAKQEFDNNIENIKSALNFYTPDECKENDIEDIRAFVTHTPTQRTQQETEKKQLYRERAKGDFDIPVKDEKLHSLIRSIQQIIKKNNDT